MFLPAERSLAAGSLRRARRNIDLRGRVLTSLVANGLRLGAGRVLRSHVDVPITPECVETHLALLLQREVRTAIFLGPPRANRKPVLQVLGTDGELLAVAKVGVNPLTSALAAREAAALRAVGERRFSTVVAPALLGEETRDGHTMVVQSPLEVPRSVAAPTPAQLHDVFNEIGRSGGVSSALLSESDYVAGLRTQVHQRPDEPLGTLGEAVLARLTAADQRLDFGAWHGDLSPWNMAAAGDRVLVWDWERFADAVPLGYDALHYTFLPRLKDASAGTSGAGVDLLDRAPTLLAGVGIAPDRAESVAMLYLIDLALRFAADGQAGIGIRGGDWEEWLIPALQHYLARERN